MRARARPLPGSWWLPALALLALPAAAQDDEQEPATLGRPAGWAVASEDPAAIEVVEGSALHLEPDHSSRVITLLPASRLPLVESLEGWAKLRYGDRVGWVDLEAPRPVGEAPGPLVEYVVELAPAEPGEAPRPRTPEKLQLVGTWKRREFGPYTLLSLVQEPALIHDLGRIAAGHGRLWSERYGLPASEIGGTLLLFPDRRAVLEFQRARGHRFSESRIVGYFHSPDLVVMYRGFHSRQELAATLIHELTHLVSWQVLRGGGRFALPLPPWLEEGLADDLSLSMLDRKGNLVAEPLGPANLHYGRRLGAVVWRLEKEIVAEGTAPSLPQLLAMDDETFLAGDHQLNYQMSSLWIRYLLSGVDEELAAGFRAYLASVAKGGGTGSDVLATRLGRSWPQLAAGFRGYLLQQRTRLGQ